MKRILIIDDENFIRLLLKRTLEDFEFEGVEIEMAPTGEEGLEKLKAAPADLIFLDLMMPGINGQEVCEEIRKDSASPQPYIVLLTAKGKVPEMPRDVGPDCALTKPFDPDQIIALTSEVLGIEIDDGF